MHHLPFIEDFLNYCNIFFVGLYLDTAEIICIKIYFLPSVYVISQSCTFPHQIYVVEYVVNSQLYVLFIVAVNERKRKIGQDSFWVSGRNGLPLMVTAPAFFL